MIHDPVWGWHLDSAKINLQHLIILGPQDGIAGRAGLEGCHNWGYPIYMILYVACGHVSPSGMVMMITICLFNIAMERSTICNR